MTNWVGTSFKMNKTLAEADQARDTRMQRFIIPTFTAIREVKQRLSATSVKVGAQNMHWDDAGAWTGATSSPASAGRSHPDHQQSRKDRNELP